MKIAFTDDVETCLRLRRIVFIDEQKVPEADEVDGKDGEALHMLAWDNGTPIGTARVFEMGDTLKIGRVCVLAEARGKGVGQALIAAALDYGRSKVGIKRALLGSQKHAVRFYEALGFTTTGPEYDDAGIPHQDMECAV